MNEASMTRDIIRDLRKAFPRAVIFKHHDLSTAGIPDMSVTFNNLTHWIELKFFKNNETKSTIDKHFDRLQLATMRLLERQGPAFYLIGMQRRAVGTALAVWSPANIAEVLEMPHPEWTLTPTTALKLTMQYVIQMIGESNERPNSL